MSPLQVAQSLGISRRTVYRLIGAGELVASRVRGQWRIYQPAIDAYLKANQNVATAA